MRIITAVVMGSLLVGSSAMADELKAVRTITVSGQAERKVVPDEAHIRVNLNSQEKQVSAAKAANDKKISKLLDLVKKWGIDEKKVRTEYSSIQPVYDYKDVQVDTLTADQCKAYLQNVTKMPGITPSCPTRAERKQILEGYRAQNNFDVTVADTKKLGELMQAIAEGGFEQGATEQWGELMSVSYTLSDSDKIRSDLLQQAIANAKTKASSMAQAAGSSLGTVWQITEGGVQFQQPVPMMMSDAPAMAMSAKSSIAPPAGEQQVTASVTISYELKN